MFAVSLALLAAAYPDMRQRAGALAAYGATRSATSFAVGPLCRRRAHQRPDLALDLPHQPPIGLFCIAVPRLRAGVARPGRAGSTGPARVPPATAGLFLLVLALLRGHEDGSTSGLIPGEAAGRCRCSPRSSRSRRASPSRCCRRPVPRPLVHRRAQIAAFAISGSFFAIFLYTTLYLQQILGLSAIEAGLTYLRHDHDAVRQRRDEHARRARARAGRARRRLAPGVRRRVPRRAAGRRGARGRRRGRGVAPDLPRLRHRRPPGTSSTPSPTASPRMRPLELIAGRRHSRRPTR